MIVSNASSMMVVTDARHRITWINPAYTRVTGWTLDEVLHKRPGEFLHGPRTNTRLLALLKSQLETGGEVRDIELINYRKNGDTYWVQLNIVPIRGTSGLVEHFVSIQSDITERKRLEQAHLQQRQRLETVQQLAQVGRIERDSDGASPTWSVEVMQMLELDHDVGDRRFRGLLRYVHHDDLASVLWAFESGLRSGDPLDLEFRVIGERGTERWLRYRGVPHAVSGGFAEPLVVCLQDITGYKARLDEKRRSNDQLQREVAARTRQLEASCEELESFSYALSHDLRSSLRRVAGFAALLQEHLAPSQDERGLCYLEKILSATQMMGELIESMLLFARLGRQGLRQEPVDMGGLVAAAMERVAGEHAAHSVQWSLPPDLPTVSGDRVLLAEVWFNLLDNALKYSRLRTPALIEVGWRREDEFLVFFVEDNGIGFDSGQADKLFGMFQRLHQRSEFEGTGIGLAVVRKIIEHHGGRIWAKAEPERGATFSFCLPLVPVSAKPPTLPSVCAAAPQSLHLPN